MKVKTRDLEKGMRVLLPGERLRTVARVEESGYLNPSDKAIYNVRYDVAPGDPQPANSALASSVWEVVDAAADRDGRIVPTVLPLDAGHLFVPPDWALERIGWRVPFMVTYHPARHEVVSLPAALTDSQMAALHNSGFAVAPFSESIKTPLSEGDDPTERASGASRVLHHGAIVYRDRVKAPRALIAAETSSDTEDVFVLPNW